MRGGGWGGTGCPCTTSGFRVCLDRAVRLGLGFSDFRFQISNMPHCCAMLVHVHLQIPKANFRIQVPTLVPFPQSNVQISDPQGRSSSPRRIDPKTCRTDPKPGRADPKTCRTDPKTCRTDFNSSPTEVNGGRVQKSDPTFQSGHVSSVENRARRK